MTAIDRRDFLARTALAGAGLTLLGRDAAAAPSPESEMPQSNANTLGVALVGLGGLSTNQLAPALQKTQHCRLAAIVTGTPSKIPVWQQRYGIPDRSVYSYETLHTIRDNPDVDIVYIVTPNALHARDAVIAARAGKHVFCEKPMDVSVAASQQIIDECRRAGKRLAVAYRCQYEPHHVECARLAREKVLGDVRYIEAAFGAPYRNFNQWRVKKELSGGGPLMDLGVYCLQTAIMVAGENPTSVSATTTNTRPTDLVDVEETMVFQLKFPSGIIANLTTSYRIGGNSFTVYADRGTFGMRPAYGYGGNVGFRSDNQPLQFPPTDQFAVEMDAFAQDIQNNTPSRIEGEMGLRDMKIMAAAYESARTGRTIAL